MRKTLVMVIIAGTIAVIASCSKGGGGGSSVDCSMIPKSFMVDVNPIVQSFCNVAGCHATGSSNGPGAITNYTQVSANKTSIRAAISSGLMPKGGGLSTSQKNSFICWIDSGAPNN